MGLSPPVDVAGGGGSKPPTSRANLKPQTSILSDQFHVSSGTAEPETLGCSPLY